MKRSATLVFAILIFFSFPFMSVHKAEAAGVDTLVKVGAGEAGEKILTGIAEKAGAKWAFVTSRDMYLKRMNLKYAEVEKEWEAADKAKFERLKSDINSVKSSDIVPIPDKPGWSKVTISAAAFLTGLDLFYEAYYAFKSSYEQQRFLEVLDDDMKEGNFYTGNGLKFIYVSYGKDNDGVKEVQPGLYYFGPNSQYHDLIAASSKVYVGGTEFGYYSITGITDSTYKLKVYFYGQVRYYGYNTDIKTAEVSKKFFDFSDGVHQVYKPTSDDIADVSAVPTSISSTMANDTLDKGDYKKPEGLGDTVDIVIPTGDVTDSDLRDWPTVSDTGADTGADTGTDTGTDTGADTGADTGSDTGADTGADTGSDTGTDTGADTGADTGSDTGADTGSDTGEKVNWDKLKNIGVTITNKFPFSLPWDILNAVKQLNIPAEKPEVHGSLNVAKITVPVDVEIPDWMDTFIPFLRWGLYVVFVIALIYGTRSLLGGGV